MIEPSLIAAPRPQPNIDRNTAHPKNRALRAEHKVNARIRPIWTQRHGYGHTGIAAGHFTPPDLPYSGGPP